MNIYKITAPCYSNEATTLQIAKEIAREVRLVMQSDVHVEEYQIDLSEALPIASFTGKFWIIKDHKMEVA